MARIRPFLPFQPAFGCRTSPINLNMQLTKLDSLPPELLLLISEHLSSVDATCLALCSRRLMARSFHNLLDEQFTLGHTGRLEEELRIDLLTRLCRELPEYHLCFACLRLHLWQHIGPPGPGFKPRDCYESRRHVLFLGHNPARVGLWFVIHFVHVHLAMRRFYLGPSYGIPTESLKYTEVSNFPISGVEKEISRLSGENCRYFYRLDLSSVDARVCTGPPGLCLRQQYLTVFKRKKLQFLVLEDFVTRVCIHDRTPASKPRHLIRSLINKYHEQGYGAKGVLTNSGECNKCPMSWKFELRDLEKQKICLALTRWWDLGPGLSPEDHQWKTLNFKNGRSLTSAEISGSPRARFEANFVGTTDSSPGFLSDEELYLRNTSLLQAQRYRKVMIPHMGRWRKSWYLQGKEPELETLAVSWSL